MPDYPSFDDTASGLSADIGGSIPGVQEDVALLSDDELCAACRINGLRATQRQMLALHEALVRIVAEITPCSVRQVFYQASVKNIAEKTEAGYDRVQRALVALRREGRIPYRSITDNTRWRIKPDSQCLCRGVAGKGRFVRGGRSGHLQVRRAAHGRAGIFLAFFFVFRSRRHRAARQPCIYLPSRRPRPQRGLRRAKNRADAAPVCTSCGNSL
jgi:hypothetical protein